MAAIPCVRCGFEFYRPPVNARKGRPRSCPDCMTLHEDRHNTKTRPTPVLVCVLAGRVADLRCALEMARRRLGMGIEGERIGRDNVAAASRDADDVMARALAAYAGLSGAA